MRGSRMRYYHSNFIWVLLEAVLALFVGIIRFIWRFATGNHLDGEPRTNAGWLERGDATLTKNGKASSWCYLPRLARAVIRWAVTLVAYLTHWGLSVAPTLTRAAWLLALLGVMGYVGLRAWRAYQIREHRNTYVIPMGQALGDFLGYSDIGSADKIEKWLSLPLDFFTSEERPELIVSLSPAQHYDDKVKTAALKLIADKLGRGLDELDWAWKGMGRRPYITVRLAPKPPNTVTFADMKPLMEKASEAAPVMGIAARNKVISSDFDAEAPHVAVSAGSGAGKSVWGRTMIAQFLHFGAQVFVLDKKRVSQNWCANLPGVIYSKTGQKMHEILLQLEQELTRRYDIIDAATDPDNADVGPRIVIFFEEQNIGMKALKKYWLEVREKSDPKKSPAIDALDELLCAGRQAKIHVVSIAQLFTVQATGGDPVARENYATRLMARATNNAWKMLLPECAPFPKINRKRGRWFIGADGVATEFQVAYFTEEEALEHATTGHVTVPVSWIPGSEQPQEPVTDEPVTEEPAPALYSLREAVEAGLVGDLTYDGLRQRKSRDKENFPEGVREGGREKWTEEQLTTWYSALTLLSSASSESNENDE